MNDELNPRELFNALVDNMVLSGEKPILVCGCGTHSSDPEVVKQEYGQLCPGCGETYSLTSGVEEKVVKKEGWFTWLFGKFSR